MNWWKKFLKNLEEANKEAFPGEGKLDCCKLKDNNQSKKKLT